MVLMSSPASSSEGRRNKSSCNSPRDRVVIAFALAIAVLPWVVWDDGQQRVTPITTELRSDIDSDVVILAVTDAETAAITGQSRNILEHYAKQVNQRRLAAAAILKWKQPTTRALVTPKRGAGLYNRLLKLYIKREARDRNT